MQSPQKSILIVALLAASSATTIFAQQTQNGSYYTVSCFKVKPENSNEFRKFISEEWRKVARARIDSGEITTWYLLRSILPQGTIADCDYITVGVFPAVPRLVAPEQISAAIQKSGMSVSTQDYLNQRNSLSTLVSVGIFHNEAEDGSSKVGDFFKINYMKVTGNIDEWVAYEKKNWFPLAQSLDKDGSLRGWSLDVEVLPSGANRPYQAVTVDIFPSMEAVFKENDAFSNHYKALSPKTDIHNFMAGFEKFRTLQSSELYELDELVTK